MFVQIHVLKVLGVTIALNSVIATILLLVIIKLAAVNAHQVTSATSVKMNVH